MTDGQVVVIVDHRDLTLPSFTAECHRRGITTRVFPSFSDAILAVGNDGEAVFVMPLDFEQPGQLDGTIRVIQTLRGASPPIHVVIVAGAPDDALAVLRAEHIPAEALPAPGPAALLDMLAVGGPEKPR